MASLNYTPSSFVNGTAADANDINAVLSQVKAFVETETVQKDGSVQATQLSLANGSVTSAKIADANITNSKIDYTSVPQMTVSTANPTGGKNGDIWVKVI